MKYNDKDLIEILLTSEFNDVEKNEDLKFLLFKFREFYRILHGNMSNKYNEISFIKKKLEEKISSLEKEIYELKVKNSDLQNQIDLMPKKKKSIFRFFGK